MPSGTPIAVASSSATVASMAVLSARSAINPATGREYSHDSPKSNRTTPPSQVKYCDASERSRPSSRRNCSRATGSSEA
jgi:hypothetical protein